MHSCTKNISSIWVIFSTLIEYVLSKPEDMDMLLKTTLPRSHKIPIVLCLLMLVGCGKRTSRPGPVDSSSAESDRTQEQGTSHQEELRIGSWNIEHLGYPKDRRSLGANIEQNPQDLANTIMKANLDVLALQEIGDTDRDRKTRTNHLLDKVFKLINQKAKQDWTYVIFSNKFRNDPDQLTAVAWNRKRVQQVGDYIKLGIYDDPKDDFSVWDRHPHAIKFSTGKGKTDFVVISIHMKSTTGRGEISKHQQQRRLEAELLLEQLPKLEKHFEESDIIILGDSNCLRKNEPAVQTYVNARFRDLNLDESGNDRPTTWKGDAPFDRIFVSEDQGEFRHSKMTIHHPKNVKDHRANLSDHFLVSTTFRIQSDDD